MSKRSRHREQLRKSYFAKGVEAARLLIGPECDLYICPLCQYGFNRTHLDSRTLTLEHVPSKSLGGKELVLTCRACNTGAGRSVDAAVHNSMRLLELQRALYDGERSCAATGRMTQAGFRTNVDLAVRAGGISINIPRDRNSPFLYYENRKRVGRLIADGHGSALALQFTPDIPIFAQRTRTGYLRSAFLATFAWFGYRYAFSSLLVNVRRQLHSPDAVVVEHAWLATPNAPNQPSMFRINSPVRAIGVSLGVALVILPWFDSPADLYAIIQEVVTEKHSVEFSGKPLGWPSGMELRCDLGQNEPAA